MATLSGSIFQTLTPLLSTATPKEAGPLHHMHHQPTVPLFSPLPKMLFCPCHSPAPLVSHPFLPLPSLTPPFSALHPPPYCLSASPPHPNITLVPQLPVEYAGSSHFEQHNHRAFPSPPITISLEGSPLSLGDSQSPLDWEPQVRSHSAQDTSV